MDYLPTNANGASGETSSHANPTLQQILTEDGPRLHTSGSSRISSCQRKREVCYQCKRPKGPSTWLICSKCNHRYHRNCPPPKEIKYGWNENLWNCPLCRIEGASSRKHRPSDSESRTTPPKRRRAEPPITMTPNDRVGSGTGSPQPNGQSTKPNLCFSHVTIGCTGDEETNPSVMDRTANATVGPFTVDLTLESSPEPDLRQPLLTCFQQLSAEMSSSRDFPIDSFLHRVNVTSNGGISQVREAVTTARTGEEDLAKPTECSIEPTDNDRGQTRGVAYPTFSDMPISRTEALSPQTEKDHPTMQNTSRPVRSDPQAQLLPLSQSSSSSRVLNTQIRELSPPDSVCNRASEDLMPISEEKESGNVLQLTRPAGAADQANLDERVMCEVQVVIQAEDAKNTDDIAQNDLQETASDAMVQANGKPLQCLSIYDYLAKNLPTNNCAVCRKLFFGEFTVCLGCKSSITKYQQEEQPHRKDLEIEISAINTPRDKQPLQTTASQANLTDNLTSSLPSPVSARAYRAKPPSLPFGQLAEIQAENRDDLYSMLENQHLPNCESTSKKQVLVPSADVSRSQKPGVRAMAPQSESSVDRLDDIEHQNHRDDGNSRVNALEAKTRLLELELEEANKRIEPSQNKLPSQFLFKKLPDLPDIDIVDYEGTRAEISQRPSRKKMSQHRLSSIARNERGENPHASIQRPRRGQPPRSNQPRMFDCLLQGHQASSWQSESAREPSRGRQTARKSAKSTVGGSPCHLENPDSATAESHMSTCDKQNDLDCSNGLGRPRRRLGRENASSEESMRKFNELFDLPKDPIPVGVKGGTVGYRDGSRGSKGRVTRASASLFKVGKNNAGGLGI